MPRIINDAGRKLITDFEGMRLEAYKDIGGVWTIGVGHIEGVQPGMTITKHQAEVIFEHDLERFEAAVERLAPKANANQFSALVSFSFNMGEKALSGSTLLKLFNDGHVNSSANEFLKWIHVGKKVSPGLLRRRTAERKLFLEPVN